MKMAMFDCCCVDSEAVKDHALKNVQQAFETAEFKRLDFAEEVAILKQQNNDAQGLVLIYF